MKVTKVLDRHDEVTILNRTRNTIIADCERGVWIVQSDRSNETGEQVSWNSVSIEEGFGLEELYDVIGKILGR